MNLRTLLKPIASLRLTVLCLGVGMLLIFAGTLDQVHLGIHAVQKKYFQSHVAIWQIPGLKIGDFHFGYLPLPGGYLLGSVLLVNLVAAHVTRFKMTWKKTGIFLIHIGIVLLLLGELFTGIFADETRMVLDKGGSANYSEAEREVELAIVDTTDPAQDKVLVIPERELAVEGVTQHPELPFAVHVRKFMGNSNLVMRSEAPGVPPSLATTGLGVQLHASPAARTAQLNQRDTTTVFAELRSGERSLGVWLLSNGLKAVQSFQFEGRNYDLAVRGMRDYKPFTLKLLDFTHDRYPGTNIPKNFSSLIELNHPALSEKRNVLIYMNNPLRYQGYTIYQSGFDNNDTRSILQVVKNPVWLMPYFACALVALGLLVQFGFHLLRFASTRTRK